MIRSALWLRDCELATNLAGEVIGNLLMSRNSLDVARERITPQFMFFTLTLQKTAVPPQMTEEFFLLHSTTTVSRVASAVDAEPLLERRVGECSMGQRRRLMIAVGFLSAAPVVLLDEPDADLDDEGRSAVDGVCRSWAEGGGVVVFASPNAVSAIASDTVMRLRDGHLEAVT